MKITRKRKKMAGRTVIKSLSMNYAKDKTIISVVYKHTEKIQTTNPKGKTNTFNDVTNYTLLDRVRVPKLMPEMGHAARRVVNALSYLDAGDISKYYQQVDWRQAAALKAWLTRRGIARQIIQVT
jgi:hypothetical protein